MYYVSLRAHYQSPSTLYSVYDKVCVLVNSLDSQETDQRLSSLGWSKTWLLLHLQGLIKIQKSLIFLRKWMRCNMSGEILYSSLVVTEEKNSPFFNFRALLCVRSAQPFFLSRCIFFFAAWGDDHSQASSFLSYFAFFLAFYSWHQFSLLCTVFCVVNLFQSAVLFVVQRI